MAKEEEEGFGKLRNNNNTKTTPYDRPNNYNYNNNKRKWVSDIITHTAHRFFSSVRYRFLPGANEDSRDRFQETVRLSPVGDQSQIVNNSGKKQCFPDSEGLFVKDGGKDITESTGLSDLELMFKQKTFSRSEIDRLTALIHSRTVESSNGNRETNTDFHPQDTVSALRGQTNYESSLHETRNGSPLDSHLGKYSEDLGRVSSAAVSPKVLEEDVASPTELAKAYMSNRSSKMSPSVLSLRSQPMREDPSALCNSSFAPRPSTVSIVQKPLVQGEVFENGFATPRSRGRSAIYSMARTPYSRVHPTASNNGNSSIYNGGSAGSSASASTGFARELVARSVSKDMALKRRSSVIDDEIGSAGPIRRLRQKTNLSTPKYSSLTMAKTPYSNRENGIVANGILEPSTSSKTLEKREDIQYMPGTSNTPVPSQSKEAAKKILQQLQNLTPKETGRVDALSQNTPTRLTLNMLHGQALRSLEDVDSTKLLQGADYDLKYTGKRCMLDECETSFQRENKVEQKGPKSVDISQGSLHIGGPSNGIVCFEDSVSAFLVSKPVSKEPITQSPPKKWGFQMSAHEDFLDLDDEIYSSEDDVSAKDTKRKNILETTSLVDSEAVSVTQGITTKGSQIIAPPASSVFATPSDKVTFDENKVVEKSNGFMFSSTPVASMFSPPVVSFNQSSDEKVPDKEPDAPLVSTSVLKIDDKIQPFTFSSSFGGESVGVKSATPVEVKQESTKSFVTNAFGTTGTVPKPAELSNGTIKNIENPEDTLEKSEATTALPHSTNSLFTFGSNPSFSSLSNGSLNSTTSHSSPAPIIPPINSEHKTLPNFTAIPFSTQNSSSAASEATPSTSTTLSSFLAPSFKFESTFTSINTTPTPLPTKTPDILESSPSTYSTVSATYISTETNTNTEKKQLPSNPFGAISSPLTGTGNSVFGFNASSTSSSGPASLSQASVFGSQTMPAFGSTAMSSTSVTSVSTPFTTSSTSSGLVFGNTTPPNNFAFGNTGTTSASLFSSSTSNNSPFGLSTTSKDSSTSSSSTMSSFGAQTPSFGSSASPSVFSFGATPQTQPAFGSNGVVPAFGSNTAVPAFGSNTAVPAFGSNTAVPAFGSNTAVSAFGSNTAVPAFGSNTAVPAFGSKTAVPAFGLAPIGINGMSEDSMSEDMAGPAPTPSVPLFGQSPPSNPSTNAFMFGSTPQTPQNGVVPFQFSGQPSQPGSQVANPFQQNGNGLNFSGSDGSFSLGSGGGGDKSNRRTVRVRKKTQRK